MEAPPTVESRIKELGQGASDAWHYLHDQVHTEIFFGGSAGPGKTFLLCLWEVTNSLRFAGTAGALFRESYDNLLKSTLVTFLEVVDKSNLVDGKHYRYKEGKNLIEWYNGSITYFDYLKYQPRDPNYTRLGGRQYTRCGIDEEDQVEERAIEVLQTRIRYRLTEFCHECAATEMAANSEPADCDEYGNPTKWKCYKCGTITRGLIPKLAGTGNPGEYWTKYRYVFTADGKPVELKPHQAVVLVKLDDNPDKAHVATYRQQLENTGSDYDRQRLLHGDWLAMKKTGREFLHEFDGSRHLRRIPYNPELALHFTMDFNTAPYITGQVAQIWWEEELRRWRIHFLKEYCLEHPLANTESLCGALKKDMLSGAFAGHKAGLFYYGDATGKNKTTMEREGVRHNFDIVETNLRVHLHNRSDRVIRRNPPHTIVRDFCNGYFSGKVADLWVTFDHSMVKTVADFVNTKEAADGSILKTMATDPVTGVRFEKYGHCLQSHYYLVVAAFPDHFARFVRK